MSSQIDHLLNETRRFAPLGGIRRERRGRRESVRARRRRPREVLAGSGARAPLAHAVHHRARLVEPAVRRVVRRRRAERRHNCLDRHVEAGNGDRIALRWEGEPGDQRNVTYAELTDEVNASRTSSSTWDRARRPRGDLPADDPEAIASMLAVARIGAVHSVVFGGFSADSLRSRIDDAGAKLVITADGGWRKGKVSPLKPAVETKPSPTATGPASRRPSSTCWSFRRGENDVEWSDDRDIWWHDVVPQASAEHEASLPRREPLFILYTSGTTGKPKGILHTSARLPHAGGVHEPVVHDVHPETDVYWCTADIGWITGHTYVAYGPLANGATQPSSRAPRHPAPRRWWELIQNHGVTVFYTAPTAIRSFMKIGRDVPQSFDLSSLRLLGSVGEPINPRGVDLVPRHHRRRPRPDRRHVVADRDRRDHDLGPPGVTETKPGSAQVPLPASRSTSSTTPASPSATATADCSSSPNPGPRCCAASGATPTASSRRTGRSSPTRATTSPATVPGSTTTATCGCSAAVSTTS